jgi:hypothetical protein
VGPVLRSTVLAWLPELGKLNRVEIAKLVGVAPRRARDFKEVGHFLSLPGAWMMADKSIYLSGYLECAMNIRQFGDLLNTSHDLAACCRRRHQDRRLADDFDLLRLDPLIAIAMRLVKNMVAARSGRSCQ